MKKEINSNVFYLSTFITLLLTYLIPCKRINDLHKSFGFPFNWFTVHNDTIGDSIMKSTTIDVFSFLFNIIAFYFIISWLYKFVGRIEK